VIGVITITGIGDHLRPDWPITFTGMRSRAGEIEGGMAPEGIIEPAM
jgi:hypothetical protein